MGAAAPPLQPVFEVRGLTYQYKSHDDAALRDVSTVIPRGLATAILGVSGSGKSTLLAILGRLIEFPSQVDQIVFHSRDGSAPTDYAHLGMKASNELRRARFGFIMSSANMLLNFSCRANIEMPLTLQGVAARHRREKLNLLLDRFLATGDKSDCHDLVRRLDAYPTDVSSGQRQRMAVLRALIHDPEVVFADEPCNSLDPYNADLFRELLRSWQIGSPDRTLVLVTHNAHEACRIASKIAIVQELGIGDLPVKDIGEFAGAEDIERRIIEAGRKLADRNQRESGKQSE